MLCQRNGVHSHDDILAVNIGRKWGAGQIGVILGVFLAAGRPVLDIAIHPITANDFAFEMSGHGTGFGATEVFLSAGNGVMLVIERNGVPTHFLLNIVESKEGLAVLGLVLAGHGTVIKPEVAFQSFIPAPIENFDARRERIRLQRIIFQTGE